MPAFSDSEYREREVRKEARITRGNALNAAAAIAGTAFPVEDNPEPEKVASWVMELASILEEYLVQAGREGVPDEPVSREEVAAQRDATDEARGQGPTREEAVRNVDEGIGVEQVWCPECEGEMWDNREKKQSGKFKATAPDFSCKNKDCKGAIWPPKQQTQKRTAKQPPKKAKEVASRV